MLAGRPVGTKYPGGIHIGLPRPGVVLSVWEGDLKELGAAAVFQSAWEHF